MSQHHSTASSWATGPVLGFDTETTGVHPCADRLVTAALIWRGPQDPMTGQRDQEVRTWLADPGIDIPPAAAQVHGITTHKARCEGRPATEVLEEVADQLAQAMLNGIPVVAFNASFDLTLMECELARHGLPTLCQRLGRDLGPILDPLVLDRAVDRYRRGKRRLDSMCEVYGVHVDEAMHTAEVDVAATLDVLQALAQAYPQLADMSLDELHTFQVQAHRDWATHFNEWLRSRGKPADADPAWPLATQR